MRELVDSMHSKVHKSRWLLADLPFDSVSDAKLAGLFLENEFPIKLFQKVFDLIFDPAFKRDEVTFEDVWDLLESVARRRRNLAKRRAEGRAPPGTMASSASNDSSSMDISRVTSPTSTPRPTMPPMVLDLVAEYMSDTALPFSVAAMGSSWSDVFRENGADFWTMSLVHRSWTPFAHAYLHRRAVIPYQCLQAFLVSPLCGPWITEIIFYWTIGCGRIGIETGDLWMLETLLSKVPNLRRLAFDTFFEGRTTDPESPYANDLNLVFEIIADVVPRLEHLTLNHFPVDEGDDRMCEALTALCIHLPKMQRLRYLSLRRWLDVKDDTWPNATEWAARVRAAEDHPPPTLRTLELYAPLWTVEAGRAFYWLCKPSGNYSLTALSLFADNDSSDEQVDFMSHLFSCAPTLERLSLALSCPEIRDERSTQRSVVLNFCKQLIPKCTSLRTLHIFEGVFSAINPAHVETPSLPPSLTDIYIHRGETTKDIVLAYVEGTDTYLARPTLQVSEPAFNLRRIHVLKPTFPRGFGPTIEMAFLEGDLFARRAELEVRYEREKGPGSLARTKPGWRVPVWRGRLIPSGWKSGHRLSA